MNLRSAIIISAVLLFVAAPAWGDSMKFTQKNSGDIIHFLDNSSNSGSGHSDIIFLKGFQKDNDNHSDFFKTKKGVFTLYVPSDDSDEPKQDPTATPEPASFSLLLAGLIAIGAFTLRRSLSTVGAQ